MLASREAEMPSDWETKQANKNEKHINKTKNSSRMLDQQWRKTDIGHTGEICHEKIDTKENNKKKIENEK